MQLNYCSLIIYQTSRMWKTALFVLLVVLIIPSVFQRIQFLGYHKTIFRHYPGKCKQVPGTVNGSEDLQVLEDGLVIISSGLNFLQTGNPNYFGRRGRLLLLNMSESTPEAQEMTIRGDFNVTSLNPHGLSLYTSPQGVHHLYVINHLSSGSVVEKLRVDVKERTLYHEKTFEDPAFQVLNDLVAVDEDKFYYTNCLRRRWIALQKWLMLRWGNVGYFDGKSAKSVVPNLCLPNGLAASSDKKTVYLSNGEEQAIDVYENLPGGKLELKNRLHLNTHPDNVLVDPEDDDVLYVGCIPIAWKSVKHISDPVNSVVPAQVLKVHLYSDGGWDAEELLADDGRRITISTVGLQYKSRLLVGSAYAEALLCDNNA